MPSAFSFFFNDTATTEIYTLSLHDALPIYGGDEAPRAGGRQPVEVVACRLRRGLHHDRRSAEHTSELQSRPHLVCRLLLEKKKETYRAPSSAVEIAHMSSSGA